jgi:hypothetical protein
MRGQGRKNSAPSTPGMTTPGALVTPRPEASTPSPSAMSAPLEPPPDGFGSPRGENASRMSLLRSPVALASAIRREFPATPVPAHEEFLLNPIQKFQRYGILPMKMILNFSIIVVLLVFIFGYHMPHSHFELDARFGLSRMLFDTADNTGPSLRLTFSTVDDAVGFVRRAVERYYELPDISPGVFMHYVDGPESFVPTAPVMTWTVLKDFNASETARGGRPASTTQMTETHVTKLSQRNGNVGPFDVAGAALPPCRTKQGDPAYIACRNSTLMSFFDRLVSARVDMAIRSVRFYSADSPASVVQWDIGFDIGFTSNEAEVVMQVHMTYRETPNPDPFAVIITVILVPLLLWHFVLRMRSFHRYHIYISFLLPGFHDREKIDRHEQHRMHERRSGTSWKIFAMACDMVCLVFCLLNFAELYAEADMESVMVWKGLFLGLSIMGYCLLPLSYIQTSPRFYVLIKTLSISIPKLAKYVFGVFPIFIGFVLCATAVFGPVAQDTFGTVPLSIFTLFALLNGDSVLQLFTQLDQTDFEPMRIFSRFFVVCFLAYFVNNALNIVLAIVQDSYGHVRVLFAVCQFDSEKCDARLGGGKGGRGERRRRQFVAANDAEDDVDADALRKMARQVGGVTY